MASFRGMARWHDVFEVRLPRRRVTHVKNPLQVSWPQRTVARQPESRGHTHIEKTHTYHAKKKTRVLCAHTHTQLAVFKIPKVISSVFNFRARDGPWT